MTKRFRRVGAFVLALSMCASMILESIPAAQAADTPVPNKPKLVMDFLGDNKASGSYYNKTSLSGGGVGDGTLPTPQDSDQAWQSAADDGEKWNGYVQADVAPKITDSAQTIFWMGIGIQDVDKFILAKDGSGLYSAEVALYYNPYYVEPYDGNATDVDDSDHLINDDAGFKACIESNMLGATGKKNQWPTPSYKVITALTDETPLNDPNDAGAQGDFTAEEHGFTGGYGTEEFSAESGWKMAYISVEMTAEQLQSTAWLSGGSHDSADTYYIAMVPFVLHHYDDQNRLCIRLARNASTFSIGSKKNNGMGQYGDGDVTYGNWDKYTFHDPDHDLKLMLDYTGDLNIFTNKREIEDRKATLIINDGGNADNKAQMIINNEPLATPSQLADASGEQIIHLSGGEELRVSAQKLTGFTVSVEVKRADNKLITPASITAVNPWTDEWTFIMPDEIDVTVTVTFVGKITPDTRFKVDLEVKDNSYNEPNNTAKLTAPGGLTTQVLTTGTDTLSGGGATAGTQITVSVTRNSDYDVVVTLTPKTGAVPTLNHIIDQSSAQTYTFTMPSCDVKVEVEFRLKTPHKATLAVQGSVATDKAALNYAKMGYTDGQNTPHWTEDVSFADAKNSPSSVPGLDKNQIQSASGRTIYIDTVCTPEYRVSSIIFRKNDDTLDTNTTYTTTTTPGRYSFVMPDYEVKVIVVYELAKTYRVRLRFDDTDAPLAGEGATLKGTDARDTFTLSLDKEQYDAFVTAGTLDLNNLMEVFSDATMGVSFYHHDASGAKISGLASGRTAEIEVRYPVYQLTPDTDIIIPSGSAGSGYSFPMKELDHPADDAAHTDAVYVIVHFKAAKGDELTAHIYNDYSAGVPANNANAVWAGAGHNKPISVHENDQLVVSIRVDPGFYIESIQVYDEGPADTYVGSPLGIPVTASGIGYNNAQGGTETASFIMPNQNATIVVKYGMGKPPEEPKFTATIRKEGDGNGIIHIKNDTSGLVDTHAAANAAWVDANTGDHITATYKPDNDSYVSDVTVSASVPGTAIDTKTTVNADGSTTVTVNTMPSANVVITVTYTKRDGKTPHQLTLTKTENPANPNNVVSATPSGGYASTSATNTTTAYENELVTATIDVAAGWYVASVTLTSNGNTVQVAPSGNGYNGGNGGNVTAVFQMPAGDATLTVEFVQGVPDNTIKLTVDDPAQKAGNTATLHLDGVDRGTADFDTSVGPLTAAAGTPVKIVVTKEPGYSVDNPILTTPSGVIDGSWTAVDTFEFTMPGEPLTVTVPFLTDSEADDDFYADLIFRDAGGAAAGVTAAKGTFLNTPFSIDSYADQLNGTLRYSRSAQPGETVPFAVQIPDGYYISNVTVTPANFGVEPNIIGVVGTQRGDFLMPAGNVRVNVYLAKGWPDEVNYRVKLHVEGPDDKSKATLKNVTANTNISPEWLPTSGQTSGSAVLTALDGEKMRVTLKRDPSHGLESITILDSNEGTVSYRWVADGDDPAVEFNVPGSSVDVYVKYTDTPDLERHDINLHVVGSNDQSTATLTNLTSNPHITTGPVPTSGQSSGSGVIDAQSGDKIDLTIAGQADALITYAYAITGDNTMISLGDPALAGTFANAVTGSHGFIMPFHTDVDVYVGFKTVTPGDNQYPLTLQVNGDNDSGSVTVKEWDSNGALQGSMSATAVGGNAMLAHGGNKITAEVEPAPNYALYSLIAYTADEERVVVSLDADDSSWKTYKFTMPENTTHIEAEFRKAKPKAYQIQVVVNNTVNNGAGNNDAFLYQPVGSLQNGFKFKSGVSAGETFDLGFIVDTGYQLESIRAIPQGSGVASNIPLPTTSSGRTQVKMPASDMVIYVTFRVDNTTRYNVIGTISYKDGVQPPVKADDGSNSLRLEGSSGETSTVLSDDTTPANSYAMIREVKGGLVEVTWVPVDGYVVSSYTVKTTSNQVVLHEPKSTNDGCFFYMPAAPVEVDVVFTKPEVAPPTDFTATLHYLQGSKAQGDLATMSFTGTSKVYSVNNDTGVISNLHVGDKIDISATPGSGRYIQTIYVLQSGPEMIQNGQTLPLQHSSLTTVPATGDFFMPSGNVDVYVVFTDTQPDPGDYVATVRVTAGGSPNNTNFAVISTDSAQATAYCDTPYPPASIVVHQQSTVTVRVTVDSNHVIERVEGTPITPDMQPQLSTGTPGAGGVTVYTFTMPANNASVVVTLKQKQATKYKLYLHVKNQVETTAGELDDDNVTKLEYPALDPTQGTLIRGRTSTPATPGAAPTASDPVIPYLETPGGSPVTLTVTPDQDYYVKAAYVVYENGLVQMVPAPLPDDYAYYRTPVGLEGTTPLDIGSVNTATFTMPQGNADVYVVYEKGEVPTTPWYNVVVIATDSGGTPGNAGHGRVKVSSSPALAGAESAISETTVPSNGLATYFYGVPYQETQPTQETIHLDASEADAEYQYDTSTGMVLTYQTAGITAAPDIHAVDTTNHPRGDVQEFGMPRSNVGVHINFTKAGVTRLWAQLHVVQADGVPGYSANTVTMSTGTGTPSYRYVDNHELTAVGPTGTDTNPDTTTNMRLNDLTSQQLISTLIHPRDSATRVVQVTITQVDKDGNDIGTTFATHAGDPTSSGNDWYNYIMGENNVHVYVVLAKKADTNRFVAVATPSYGSGVTATTGGTGELRNEITKVSNITTTGLSSAPYWTEIKAKDRVKVEYTAQVGVYVEVEAYRAGTSTKLPSEPIEFGVGNGSAGYAYVDIPDPGCNVEIVVKFTKDPPTPKTLSFISHGHAGKEDNQTELQKKDDTGSFATLSGILKPTVGTLTDIIWPTAPDTHSETPGVDLKVLINSLEPGYEVEKVEVKVDTFIIDYHMKEDPDNANTLILVDSNGDKVDLKMPNGDTVITVYFKEKDDGLVPFDPRNTDSTKYKKNWIKAENRGDYLVVTVPLLNNTEGTNRTSVTWTDAKKDRFKFYLDETPSGATTPVYTSLDYILKRSRPSDAPDTTGTEPYWKDNFLDNYYSDATFEGARFILEVMTDKEIEDDHAITNKDTAKKLAAILRKIMDNDGTKANDDKYSLYISCEETTYKEDGSEDKKTEGAKVDFEVPRYYSLLGSLVSYAPAHIATFTFADEAAESKISFTSKLEGVNGVDLWQQDFKVKLTSDFDGKLKDKSFTLTIRKAGHVTYTRTTIKLDTSASAPEGTYNADNLAFTITDTIALFCGDIDNNGYVEQGDVQLLIAATRGHLKTTKAKTPTEAGWASSVYNPKSFAYACDLNGDWRIDIRDMNIVTDRNYYGRDAADYGSPTGLTNTAHSMLLLQPQWYVDMVAAGMTVPEWADTMVKEEKEIPEWVGNLLKTNVAIPKWVENFVTTNIAIPDWARDQVVNGKTVPDWAVELIENNEELLTEVSEMLAQGQDLPETKPEPVPAPVPAPALIPEAVDMAPLVVDTYVIRQDVQLIQPDATTAVDEAKTQAGEGKTDVVTPSAEEKTADTVTAEKPAEETQETAGEKAPVPADEDVTSAEKGEAPSDDNTEETPVAKDEEPATEDVESSDDNTEETPVDKGEEPATEDVEPSDDNTEETPVDKDEESATEDVEPSVDNTEETPVDKDEEPATEDVEPSVDNTEETPVDKDEEPAIEDVEPSAGDAEELSVGEGGEPSFEDAQEDGTDQEMDEIGEIM